MTILRECVNYAASVGRGCGCAMMPAVDACMALLYLSARQKFRKVHHRLIKAPPPHAPQTELVTKLITVLQSEFQLASQL